MNCKPGDLAVIVRADNKVDRPHIGKIVECIYWLPDEFGGMWRTEPRLKVLRGPCKGREIGWHDGDLRPIRDNDGEDEMLRIVGKPQEVTA